MSYSPSDESSGASSSFSQPLFHTVTLSSLSTADQCVINIPVADYTAPETPTSAAAPNETISTISTISPPPDRAVVTDDSSSRATSRSVRTSSPSFSSSSSPASVTVPVLDVSVPAAAEPSGSSSSRSSPLPASDSSSAELTVEQRRQRRKVKHRGIDACRREKEASALAELEKALSAHDRHTQPTTEQSLVGSRVRESSVESTTAERSEKRQRRTKSKAAVITAAATRISQLQHSSAAMHQQLEQRQIHHGLSLAYATFFHTSPVQAVIFSLGERRCVDANEAFCRFTGYSHRQLQQSRLAFCPGQRVRPTSSRSCLGTAEAGWEQWEVDASGNVVPVSAEQLQLNMENLGRLLDGSRRTVQCVFRIALAGRQLTESQCDCWLTGEPMTASEDCATTTRFIVVQTTAERYRAHLYRT